MGPVTTIPSFMPFVQAAISVSDAIETYGAYAGLAAVVGLGVLSLLYFAQAREVKRLREWAAGSEEREADLTRRIVAQASRAAAASRPLAPQTAAGKGQKPVPKAAPATVAAAAAVAKVADPPTGPHAVPAAATAAATATPPAAGDGATTVAPAIPAKPAAAPPAGAPNGQPPMAKPAEIPAKPAVAAEAPAAQDTGDTGPVQPVRTTAPRPARAATPVAAPPPRGPARRADEGGGRSTGKVLGIVAGVVLGIAVVGFGATQLLGGDDAPAPSNTVGETVAEPAAGAEAGSGESTRTTSTTGSGGNAPSSVNVAVLNGTTVTGLAAEIAQQVEQAGYIRGTVTNSPDQSRSATIVSFREGSRSDALKVAQQIGVGEDAVQPLDPSDAVTAGEDADVVVIVGADRTDLP